MNDHFEDAWYYGKRASKHLRRGLGQELEPVKRRVRKAIGREKEANRSRTDRLQAELKEREYEAERRARRVVRRARRRV
jgi:hypothetical protein